METLKINNLDFHISNGLIRNIYLREELLYNIEDPDLIIQSIKDKKIKADIFTFIQNIPDLKPKYKYRIEWDNLAVVPIKTYDEWLKNQIHRNARKRIKHVKKHAVKVVIEKLDKNLAKGLQDIFNETPKRQGRHYPYYGMPLEEIIKRWSPDLDQSDFLVAYHKNEVIGFIKLLYTKYYARASGTVTKLSHRQRAPMTFLLAKAVEVCAEKKIPYLIYGKFDYYKKEDDGIREFKKNTGFNKVDIPRYYIPLSIRGKIGLILNLHHGIKGILPVFIIKLLFKIRYFLNRMIINVSKKSNKTIRN